MENNDEENNVACECCNDRRSLPRRRTVKAQGVPQTVEIAKVDVQKVAAGYRASKVIGSSVLTMRTKRSARLTTSL